MTNDIDALAKPAIGFGTYALTDPARSVAAALDMGYRVVDTAASYDNEVEVGRGIAASAVPREEVLVTSKLRGDDQGAGTRAALEQSLRNLDVDYLDLYLIHWPLPELDRYRQSFEQMLQLRDEGLISRVGVSNFLPEHLIALHEEFGEWPAVNQLEIHPYFPQVADVATNLEHGIQIQSWSPLGPKTDLLSAPEVRRVAAAHECSAAQAVLAWHVTRELFPIPKTDSAERAAENLAAGKIRLSESEVQALNTLERGRTGGDPRTHVEM